MTNDANWLLVPIEVSALVVGKDANNSSWANFALDFSLLEDLNPRLLGPDLVNRLTGNTKTPEAGIHLHWFLPEAFGRGIQKEGRLTFPRIPNRWLVRRIRYLVDGQACVGVDNNVQVDGWVIESDFLYGVTKDNRNTLATTNVGILRLGPASNNKLLFDRIGKQTPVALWKEENQAYRFELTVLGAGSPEFSAHYPACKNVLGFYDPAPLETLDTTKKWQVSYLVQGWCSDPSQDLLNGLDRLEAWQQKLDELKWQASAPSSTTKKEVANRILCHGAISRIPFNPGEAHQSPVPQSNVNVFVGNTPEETIATLLSQKISPQGGSSGQNVSDQGLVERLLAAYQYNLLESEMNLGDLDAELHRHRFSSTHGGDHFVIQAQQTPVQPASTLTNSAETNFAPASVTTRLPAEIERQLDELNQQAEVAGRLQRILGSNKQTLFVTWAAWATESAKSTSKLNQTKPDPIVVNNLNQKMLQERDAVGVADTNARLAAHAQESLRSELVTLLQNSLPDLELVSDPQPPFYGPVDPVVLVQGEKLAASGVYRQDSSDQKLVCRQQTEIVSGLAGKIKGDGTETAVKAIDLFPLKNLNLPAGPANELLDDLLRELLLLDPVNTTIQDPSVPISSRIAEGLQTKSGVRLGDPGQLVDAIKTLLKSAAITNSATPSVRLIATSTAVRPDERALMRFTKNPWRPLLLTWQIRWQPDYAYLDPTPTNAGKTSWGLDETGNEFQLLGNPPTSPTSATNDKKFVYQSYTILSPNPTKALRRKLVDLGHNSQINALLSTIDDLKMLAQSLGGFHDGLRQLRQGLQLEPIDPGYLTTAEADRKREKIRAIENGATGMINGIVKPFDPQQMLAPDPALGFAPIRAGIAQITSLSVVDSFGQVRKLIDEDKRIDAAVSVSSGMPQIPKSPGNASTVGLIPLPPRYAQPARLNFRWIPADETQSGSTPLCGWIFLNQLDQCLMICDSSGRLLGGLQRILRVTLQGGTGGAITKPQQAFFWVPVPGTETTPVQISDRYLKQFVQNLLQLGADAGATFLNTLSQAQQENASVAEQDPRLSILIGRPLALARASIQLELMGLPATRVPSANDFKNLSPPTTTSSFPTIPFTVQLGGMPGVAGGLAGYLLDSEPQLYHPQYGLQGPTQTVMIDQKSVKAIEYRHTLPINADPKTQALRITLLLDPNGPVHARCGVLPCFSLRLPKSVTDGISSIRDVFFQSAPLIGPAGGPKVPTPSDDYGQWSWAARPQVTYWKEYNDLQDPGDQVSFQQSPTEIQEGWLKLVMNPVNISAFWVKQGSVKVPKGSKITLGWLIDGATSITLTNDKTKIPIKIWPDVPDGPLPNSDTLQIDEKITLTLTAFDKQGHKSAKSLQINTI